MAIYVGGTVLLLHGDGADASTVFTDETGKAVTAYGNAKISTAQSKFGGASMYFDGSSRLELANSNDFNFGLDDFSVECQAYTTSVAAGERMLLMRQVSGTSMALQLRQTGGTQYQFILRDLDGSGITDLISASGAVIANTWTHVEAGRNSGVAYLAINGQIVASKPANVNLNCDRPFVIGAYNDSLVNSYWQGYLDEIRVNKYRAAHSANFTPPSAPLGLLNPVQVSIQAQNPGLHKLAKFDPSLSKPAMQGRADDLQNRMPYGPWKTPQVVLEFVGRGIVTGTVAEKSTPANTPLHRLVRLHREPDGLFVKATWSDPVTGAYTFTGVRADHKYFVTSFDYTGTYRAVIADNLTPELLP